MNRYLKRARDGDPTAIEALTEALRPRISKMAAYYGRFTGQDTDDLLQEAWIGLLEAIPELKLHIGSPEQYLIARARWKLLDAIKRARVRSFAPLDDEDHGFIPPQTADQAVSAACASEFVDMLQENQKQVLACLMAGLTWREAGQVLGCSSANIAYHVRRIRLKYEEWLEEPAAV